jgi:anti-anti-sigma regulatory factor
VLRITRKFVDSSLVVLALEGRIVSDWVPVLEAECTKCMIAGAQVHLDFSGVTYVDASGTELIRSLGNRGVRVVNCLEVILELLQGNG